MRDDRPRVFICYKKPRRKNTEAEIFHFLLDQDGTFDPWVDDGELSAGMLWEMEIYRQILASDVVALLVEQGTSESEWVRRELALATALGISIVPIGFDLTDEQMVAETKALSVSNVQFVRTDNIRLRRGEALLAELGDPLRKAVAATRERQRDTLEALWRRRKMPRTRASDDQHAASFHLVSNPAPVRLHVASGDIAKMRNIDVFVNPENDYMQMARFFESHTVSSTLRRLGSTTRAGLFQDTIQQELDWHLRGTGRPVQASHAFPTSAGGPGSDLAKVNKARVIMHVAAVQAVAAESRVIPYKQPHQIEASVRNVLAAVAALNAAEGVFSRPGSDQHAQQKRLAAAGEGKLRSIIFPLFGTGEGGASPAEVITPMVEGLVGYLSDADNLGFAKEVRDVYISAYAQEDVEVVTAELDRRLARAGEF